ncbi:bifunctional NADP phosphatase/NAD kinase [Methanotorris formicicus]|uniref:NAD kinase n=1 Tax=Methanotorris formicicus Mc-S-70 TaxID=647171 RepID=H1KXD6_9EURY|nr:bifunctional NADP phosphatase/NAD kinase [Methanotorris formicicus]EHP88348.1 Inositol-phosphate phosphatase, NAD(+) kinase [Methanotorris formicicus Mc-S-70]
MDMLNLAKKIVDNIDKGVKPLIGWEKSDEVIKIGADGTPTKRIDLIAENIASNTIEKYCGAVLISEEIGINVIGKDLEYIIILDPIDGTYNALKDIPIYSTSVAIGRINEDLKKELNNMQKEEIAKSIKNQTINDLEVGVVKNLYTGDLYYAKKGEGAYLLKNGEKKEKKIIVSPTSNLKDASIGLFVYGLSNNILDFIKDKKVRRIRLFGSIALEMCYVARGALDAFININENTRLCDIAGGYVIVKEAGGEITDKNGKELNLRLDVNERTSLICSNKLIHKKLVGIFGNKWAIKPTKFAIITRRDKERAIDLGVEIVNYLNSKGIKCTVEPHLKKKLVDIDVEEINSKDFKSLSSISHVVSIGGDGTVLRTLKLIDGNEIPLISINMGMVGFLTEFNEEEVFKVIDDVVKGEYEIEKRTRLSGKIKFKNGKESKISDALNEVVLITKNPAKMLHFEVFVNGNFVEDVRADGIIISTPTGSTAYSLSAGGPIIEPLVDGFVIVPICPFKLSSRPIVVNGNSEIRIRLISSGKPALVVVDGDVESKIDFGDEVILKKSDSYAYFVKGGNFYNKLKKLYR